jgi:CO/xanthine dehydrogenase Mo-binding subunit
MTNKVGVGISYPGAPQGTFALESTVDELCQKLQMDAVEFRLKNGLKEVTLPWTIARGRVLAYRLPEQVQQQSLGKGTGAERCTGGTERWCRVGIAAGFEWWH